MPYYVLENFSNYPGLSGLFVSGILSASLSTLSSIMNSLAAILLEDYVKVILIYITFLKIPDNFFVKIIYFLASIFTMLQEKPISDVIFICNKTVSFHIRRHMYRISILGR